MPFFKLETGTRQTGARPVRVSGKIRRGDVAKSVYLQLPQQTVDQLDAALDGPTAPGIVGLIEWAVAELDRQNLVLNVSNET